MPKWVTQSTRICEVDFFLSLSLMNFTHRYVLVYNVELIVCCLTVIFLWWNYMRRWFSSRIGFLCSGFSTTNGKKSHNKTKYLNRIIFGRHLFLWTSTFEMIYGWNFDIPTNNLMSNEIFEMIESFYEIHQVLLLLSS